MSLLTLDRLSLHIDRPLLREVCLDLAPGEVLGLVGESGSGKSMTALSIMGLLPAGAQRTGRILFDGEDISARPDATMGPLRGARIGMVFQEPMRALNPLQTIGAQVSEVIRRHRPGADALALAAAALTRAGLPPDQVPLSRYPHDLSGGQRQRVVIAMATALRPPLLIADEPTTALDVTTQAKILTLLKDLAAEDGAGLILITHDLSVAAQMCDRIAIMDAGAIIETGPALPLLRTPAHPRTRALIAAAAHRPARRAAPPGPEVLAVSGALRTHPLPRTRLFGPRPQFTAVDRVSLEIHAGETLALVGESGCGKSTLARAILGLEPLQAGTLRLSGRPFGPGASPGLRRHIQAVFQDPSGSFNPRWRVGRLVAEPFHLMPDPPRGAAARARVARMLDAVGLPADAIDRRAHEFSGGQRQRIAIARALITNPKLVVLDEAVSALDVSVRAKILDLLAELSHMFNLSYLFISHDLHVVRAIADRVMVMQAGRIVEEGQTEALFTAPKHPWTRALLAAAPDLDAVLAARGAGGPQGPMRGA